MDADAACVTQIVQAGASGYLPKDSADVDFIQAVAAIFEGKSFPTARTICWWFDASLITSATG
jgi:DNA-binding NarL/FixJ family response regulator